MTPVVPAKPKLPDWMRDHIRLRHCSILKEMQYLQWVKRFILFHDKRHPVDMGATELEAFLTYLAVVLSQQEVADVSGHSDVSTTMIYMCLLNKGDKGISSPLDHL